MGGGIRMPSLFATFSCFQVLGFAMFGCFGGFPCVVVDVASYLFLLLRRPVRWVEAEWVSAVAPSGVVEMDVTMRV